MNIIKYIFIDIACIIGLVLLMVIINIIAGLAKGQKIPKRTEKSTFKRRNLLVRIFWDLPKAIARDFFSRNPDSMNIHGLYVFCGEQGAGKTIAAAIQFIRTIMQKYPKVRMRSNISINFQKVDTNDSVELMCALIRLETIQQITKDISVFIRMRTRQQTVSFVINPNN